MKMKLKDTPLWAEVASSNDFDFVSKLTVGSNKKILWLCEKGHEWPATVGHRYYHNSGCSICAGTRIVTGVNDLASLFPHLHNQWDSTKNGDLLPEEVGISNKKSVWWKCGEGHEWSASIFNRARKNSGCPYCSGLKPIVGETDLSSTHPILASEWHPTKNLPLTPQMVKRKTNKKVWWLGDCGHEWFRSINAITKNGCPYCTKILLSVGENDLSATHPEVMKFWHPTKNGNIKPTSIFSGTESNAWWLGKCGHEWERSVRVMTRGVTSCPYCSGRRTLKGFNDLVTTHPKLVAEEWDFSRNSVAPETFLAGSNIKVHWKCKKSHKWQAIVYDRARGDLTGCPQCYSSSFVSKVEKEVADFVKSLGFEVETSNRSILRSQEIDIYIPSMSVAVEFNGLFYHTEHFGKNQNYHYSKWLKCKEQGIELIQIWEDEWRDNPTQIKRLLASKLGASQEEKVFAVNAQLVEISQERAEKFLNKNHLQGFALGSRYLALFANDMVAVMVLDEEVAAAKKTLNIIRYAASINVVDGFTRLVSFVEEEFKPSRIIGVSDNSLSDEDLYLLNGFVKTEDVLPDYTYFARNERRDKSSVGELPNLNDSLRIWDAGKTKWEKSFWSASSPGATEE